MRSNLIFLLVLLWSLASKAQQVDTLIYAQGNIVNGTTKEPVSARISYQSLPYGNKLGILNGSNFLFPLFDGNKYSITVEAPGFAPSKYILDPAEANTERRVIKDIELALPASASKVAEITHTVGKVMRLENLIFSVGTAKITADSYAELNEVVKMLKENPSMVVQLEGHTDVQGDTQLNMKLSQQRVEAVKNYLIKEGCSKGRIKTKAFGGKQPLSLEDTEEAHKMNRRVELRVLKN